MNRSNLLSMPTLAPGRMALAPPSPDSCGDESLTGPDDPIVLARARRRAKASTVPERSTPPPTSFPPTVAGAFRPSRIVSYARTSPPGGDLPCSTEAHDFLLSVGELPPPPGLRRNVTANPISYQAPDPGPQNDFFGLGKTPRRPPSPPPPSATNPSDFLLPPFGGLPPPGLARMVTASPPAYSAPDSARTHAFFGNGKTPRRPPSPPGSFGEIGMPGVSRNTTANPISHQASPTSYPPPAPVHHPARRRPSISNAFDMPMLSRNTTANPISHQVPPPRAQPRRPSISSSSDDFDMPMLARNTTANPISHQVPPPRAKLKVARNTAARSISHVPKYARNTKSNPLSHQVTPKPRRQPLPPGPTSSIPCRLSAGDDLDDEDEMIELLKGIAPKPLLSRGITADVKFPGKSMLHRHSVIRQEDKVNHHNRALGRHVAEEYTNFDKSKDDLSAMPGHDDEKVIKDEMNKREQRPSFTKVPLRRDDISSGGSSAVGDYEETRPPEKPAPLPTLPARPANWLPRCGWPEVPAAAAHISDSWPYAVVHFLSAAWFILALPLFVLASDPPESAARNRQTAFAATGAVAMAVHVSDMVLKSVANPAYLPCRKKGPAGEGGGLHVGHVAGEEALTSAWRFWFDALALLGPLLSLYFVLLEARVEFRCDGNRNACISLGNPTFDVTEPFMVLALTVFRCLRIVNLFDRPPALLRECFQRDKDTRLTISFLRHSVTSVPRSLGKMARRWSSGSQQAISVPRSLGEMARRWSSGRGEEIEQLRIPLRAESAANTGKEKARNMEMTVGPFIKERTALKLSIYILFLEVLMVWWMTGTTNSSTELTSMLTLHHMHTLNPTLVTKAYVGISLDLARSSVVPELYQYDYFDGCYCIKDDAFVWQHECPCRQNHYAWQSFKVVTTGTCERNGISENCKTVGRIMRKTVLFWQSVCILLSALFVLVIWIVFEVKFTENVLTLVVQPIKVMIQLLSILSNDLVGYKNTPVYKNLLEDEKERLEKSNWSKEVIDGMETSFLMNTIKTIGSLLEVSFGSAGVEIIQNNLKKSKFSKRIFFSQSGIPVECLFLFCDIRNFTNITEILNEDIFLFTNKVAAVVHSFCHSLGGAANKNIGDAFLISWRRPGRGEAGTPSAAAGEDDPLKYQADKALLSVIRIAIALYDDQFYLDGISARAKTDLENKLRTSSGSLVRLGFGLHAGVAVQGAIGSIRKIDATYISEQVDMAETLECATKSYKVPLLMSNAFHFLLTENRQEECRRIDQLRDKQDVKGDTIELYTWDMDIENIWKDSIDKLKKMDELPDSVIEYDPGLWEHANMKLIREKFGSDFLLKYKKALNFYTEGYWKHARNMFRELIRDYQDGPSNYFVELMKENDFLPARDFTGTGQL